MVVFKFLRTCQTIFQSGCDYFILHYSSSCPAFLASSWYCLKKKLVIVVCVKAYYIVVLIWVSQWLMVMTFFVFLPFVYHLWWIVFLNFLPFKRNWVVYLFKLYSFSLNIWDINFSSYYIACKIFFSSSMLSFYFLEVTFEAQF
jgi:hypothetical protein